MNASPPVIARPIGFWLRQALEELAAELGPRRAARIRRIAGRL